MNTKTTATLLPVSSPEELAGRKEDPHLRDTPEAIDKGISPPPEIDCSALAVYRSQGHTDRFSWTDKQLNMLYPIGYEVKGGCLKIRKSPDENVESELVCNFTAWIVSEVTLYDGLKRTTRLVIAGKHSNGSVLREVTIDAGELAQNDWIMNNWGLKCIFANRYGVMNQFAHALQHTVFSARHSDRYCVTGWYKDADDWRYLMPYEDDPTVELPVTLRRYGLIREHDKKSISDTCELLTHPPASKKVIYSLLAFTFLTPLMHFLDESGNQPNFVYLLYGKTGSKKSTLAALFLSFFGNFSATTLPQSFRDTANSITRTAFHLKDVMTVVDDIYPTASSDQSKLTVKVQEVLREFSNRTGRGRLNSDSTPMESRPPRANAIFTAEYVPDLGESGTARFFLMELDGKEVNNDLLSHYQTLSEDGAFRKCMYSYTEWIRCSFLKDNHAGFVKELEETFKTHRKDFLESGLCSHGRVAANSAWLMIGFRMFLKFMVRCGCMDTDEAHDVSKEFSGMLTPYKHQTSKVMKDVIDYCCQEKKVRDAESGLRLVSGVDCDGENAFAEFMTTKDCYRKDYPSALTVSEVGRILRVSDKLVYRLIRDDSIAAVKVGRTYRIAKSNLIDYMRSRDRNSGKPFLC